MIDNKGKLFGKISIIDLFAIILIVAVIAGGMSKLAGKKVASETRLKYTVEIPSVRDLACQYYVEDLMVAEQKTNSKLGKIESVSIEPALSNLETIDGTVVQAELLGSKKVVLTITCDGAITDKAYLAYGTYEIKAGSLLLMKSRNFEVSGKVLSVEEI